MIGLVKRMSLLVGLAGVCVSAGCASNVYPGGPTIGASLYQDVVDPAQNLAVATNAATGMKRGESSSMAVLGVVAIGDAGLEAAMKNGGITKVHHVDHESMLVLYGVYVKATTIVYGE